MKTSNELHDLWIAQGDKVENLNEKLNVAMLDDSVTAEESLITRQTMLTALISINLSLLKCYLVGKPLLIDGEMKMGGI